MFSSSVGIFSYIIPVPVIKHFIAGVEESGKYVGFCSLGLSCQPIENVQLRNHFRMRPEMTGVLVSKINPLSDAYKVLKKDDIILVFDGVPVANDGTGSHLLFPNFNNTNVVVVRGVGSKRKFCCSPIIHSNCFTCMYS